MTRTGWLAVAAVIVVAGTAGWIGRGLLEQTVSAGHESAHEGHTAGDISHYTCPMHPSVKLHDPDAPCPICGMDLTPVPRKAGSHEGHTTGAISHYTCPMHPSVKSQDPDAPCPICGMDLTPVPAGPSHAPSDQDVPGFIHVTPYQQQLIGVTTGVVEEQPVLMTIRTIGHVQYDETRLADVNLKVSGWIRDLYVDHAGQPVRKGDPLFTLYSPELVATQEEYLLAYRGYNRISEFGDVDGTTVGSSVWSESLLASARERLELWDLTDRQVKELETIGKRSTSVTVFSPSDGIVVDRMAVSGMFVKPGMRLYRIARLDSVWVMADVYERDLGSAYVGQPATIALSNRSGRTYQGVVDYVYPYLNPKTRTATVRIRVANDGSLKPDTFTDVHLRHAEASRVLVPDSAVLYSGKRRIVFLDKGEGRFQPHEVVLGRRFSSGYEVLEGLKPGDRVVTSGNFLLDSESKLRNVSAGGHQH